MGRGASGRFASRDTTPSLRMKRAARSTACRRQLPRPAPPPKSFRSDGSSRRSLPGLPAAGGDKMKDGLAVEALVAGDPAQDYHLMVLLVDDQVMVGEAVRRSLVGESDIEFHFCTEPSQAMEVARRVQPTVILQDLVMPNVSGLDLVRQYRANPMTAAIPVIVM